MPNFARIIDNVAVDVSTDPQNQFHGDIASAFEPVPDEVAPGWRKTAGVWAAPPAPPAPAVVYEPMIPMQFYLAFKPAERIAIKTSTNPAVQEFWATYQIAKDLNSNIDPNLSSVIEGLEYLTTTTPPILASEDRINQIRAGIAQ